MDYFKYGAELAKSVKGQHKVACVVLDKKGGILSTGVNSFTKTHPKQLEFAKKVKMESDRINFLERKYLHAEIAAMLKCPTQGHKIVVVRINNKGEYRMAKPCPICELAIKSYGITKIEYTTGKECYHV